MRNKRAFHILLLLSVLLVSAAARPVAIIRFGLFDNPPLSQRNAAGEAEGFVIEILEEIAARENWRIEYVPCGWSDCLEMLAREQIDLLGPIAYSEQRAHRYDFNQETLITNWGHVYAAPASDIVSLLDLAGRQIALMQGDIHTNALAEMLVNFDIQAEFVYVDDYAAVFAALDEGTAEAGVVNHFFALAQASKYDAEPTAIIYNPIELRFAVKQLDRHLAAMKADHNSPYYAALETWAGGSQEKRLPVQVLWAVALSLSLALIFFSASAVLRYQVNQKTAELNANIDQLQAEIFQREMAEAETQRYTADLELINTLNEMANQGASPEEIFHFLNVKTKQLFSGNGAHIHLLGADDKMFFHNSITALPASLQQAIETVIGRPLPVVKFNPHQSKYYRQVIDEGRTLVLNDAGDIYQALLYYIESASAASNLKVDGARLAQLVQEHLQIKSLLMTPLIARTETIGFLNCGRAYAYSKDDVRRLEIIASQVTSLIQRIKAEESIRQSEQRYRELFEYAPISLWEEDFSAVKAYLDDLRGEGAADLAVHFQEHPESLHRCAELVKILDVNQATVRLFQAESKDALLGALPKVLDPDAYAVFKDEILSLATGDSSFSAEIDQRTLAGETIHTILTLRLFPGYERDWARVLVSIMDITERKKAEDAVRQAEAQLARQVEFLQAVHTIDTTISASLDIKFTTGVILDQIRNQLKVDAADILTYDPTMQVLECANHRGFISQAWRRPHLQVTQGLAGQVVLGRKLVKIDNLKSHASDFPRAPQFNQENFQTYIGLPLVSKGEVKGVLEIFQRRPLNLDGKWLDFLETLAGQAAIAIENATLFDNLQRSNTELRLSYDHILEGWARANELRAREPGGHARHVTELAVRLAEIMELNDDQIGDLRRGALLHDIGLLGIPDRILHKPGPLDAKEWEAIRQHPLYAKDLLAGIPFLKNALQIPLYHHEKWDGSGYPHGMRGEQIPLMARIFAVVDVWDALRSDRPFRRAWSEEKAYQYILSQAGAHFDPQVVKAFKRLKKNGGLQT